MTVTPLRTRTEAINKIPTLRTPKQYKSFCGVVNYLSLFCQDLQTLLKPKVSLQEKVDHLYGVMHKRKLSEKLN